MLGIDEVGRGPLAGPVGIGVVKVSRDFDWALIPGVGDSKVIKPEQREALFRRATALRANGVLDFKIQLISASYIDTHGIVSALNKGISQALKSLNLIPEECFIKLDGGLRAPKEFSQETIIKGDALEPVIGLASILAKVTRDRHMVQLHKKYPEYEFLQHKGYGTKLHRARIKEIGLTPIHRVSYCQNILGE